MDKIEHFIEYISQYDKDFRQKIAGTPEPLLQQYEQFLGFKLPDILRGYWLAMGEKTPLSLFDDEEGTGQVSELYQLCVDVRLEENEEMVPKGMVLLWRHFLGGGYVFKPDNNGVDGTVYYSLDDGEEVTHYLDATSFEKFIYHKTFYAHVVSKLRNIHDFIAEVSDIKPGLAEAMTIMRSNALKELWFSDLRRCFYQTEGVSVAINLLHGDDVLSLILGGENKRLINDLIRQFKSVFRLEKCK